ncbi:hypothetical protein ILUMI_03082 [Ignelater luminosus]|uniref:THAP-type domain-containing protein n=1 Tax=Ignelater luminosus TaxID=2038154 RepID=A0A8K0DH09_IGNLU|nr:hypothetical protein ILUMI_03082 [Ignelater luminosus]
MHGFPQNNIKLKNKWKILLKIDKGVTNSMKVCSAHFTKSDYILPDVPSKKRSLKGTAYPSINLLRGSCDRKVNIDQQRNRASRYKQREEQQADTARLKTAEILLELAEGHHKNATDNSEHTVDVDNSEHTADVEEEQLQVNNTPIFSDISCQVNTFIDNSKFDIADIVNNEYWLKFCTGIPNMALFNVLSNTLNTRIGTKNFCAQLLIPGHDAIMVDKGFLIDDECKKNYIQLYQPPFLGRGKSQFSKEEAEETAEIARARVHVERRIQRLKNFTLLKNRYSWTLLPLIDDILVIVSALVNLSEPILSSDKF